MLGSSFIRLSDGQRSILFSGDIGRPNDPVLKAPAQVDGADYLVVESTYGNRTHEPSDALEKLAEVINRTAARGGVLVIPAFAVGRAQSLLYGIFFIVVAIVGIISTHTVLSHMWQARNVWFAALLIVQCVMLVVSSIGDAIDTGSPWGVQEASRVASVLLGLRLRVLVPVTVIFSIGSVFASWPPSYCAEC